MSLLMMAARESTAAPAFSPADLFASGEKGYWYDPSDFSTMFQDIAGTTPVTAAGQFVGKILDKSGNGNHLTAMSASARGVLQQTAGGHYYIDCDGIDDGYQTVAAVSAGAASKAALFFAFKPDEIGFHFLVESSAEATYSGTYLVNLNHDGQPAGTTAVEALFTDAARDSSTSKGAGFEFAPAVLSVQYDYTAAALVDKIRLRRNAGAVAATYGPTVISADTFKDHITYFLGRTGTQYLFDGRIFGIIGRFAESTAGDITATENWLNERCGAF